MNRTLLHLELTRILAFAKDAVDKALLPVTMDSDTTVEDDFPVESVAAVQLLQFLIKNRESGYFKSQEIYRKHVKGLTKLMIDHPHDLLKQISDLIRTYYQKAENTPKGRFREEVKRSLKYAMLIAEKNIVEGVDAGYGGRIGKEMEKYPLESKSIFVYCLFLKNIRQRVGIHNDAEYVKCLNIASALLEYFPGEVMDALKRMEHLLMR